MAKTPLQAFKRHIDRFGSEGIMETAVELMTFEDLVALQRHIDAYGKKSNKYQPKPRLTAETRVKRLMGCTDEEEEPSAPTN